MTENEQKSSPAEWFRATVRGYVQGVGFRVFIRSRAWDLGIKGYVRNMPDGAMLVVAQGKRESLELLLDEVWRGPAGAHVKSVDVEWLQGPAERFASHFEVRL